MPSRTKSALSTSRPSASNAISVSNGEVRETRGHAFYEDGAHACGSRLREARHWTQRNVVAAFLTVVNGYRTNWLPISGAKGRRDLRSRSALSNQNLHGDGIHTPRALRTRSSSLSIACSSARPLIRPP
jgi:hypothetical protein